MDEHIYIKKADLGLTDFEIIMCNGNYKKALEMLLDKIAKAPVSDVVEVITTSWEDIERIGFGSFEATCKRCKRRMMYMTWWKYCPECGAKVEVK